MSTTAVPRPIYRAAGWTRAAGSRRGARGARVQCRGRQWSRCRARGGGRWESARNKTFALDFATQAQEMKAIGGQPDYALGSAHAVTRDGTHRPHRPAGRLL